MRKVSLEYSGLLIAMYIERVHALQLIHFRGVSRAQTTFDSNQNKHRSSYQHSTIRKYTLHYRLSR